MVSLAGLDIACREDIPKLKNILITYASHIAFTSLFKMLEENVTISRNRDTSFGFVGNGYNPVLRVILPIVEFPSRAGKTAKSVTRSSLTQRTSLPLQKIKRIAKIVHETAPASAPPTRQTLQISSSEIFIPPPADQGCQDKARPANARSPARKLQPKETMANL